MCLGVVVLDMSGHRGGTRRSTVKALLSLSHAHIKALPSLSHAHIKALPSFSPESFSRVFLSSLSPEFFSPTHFDAFVLVSWCPGVM